MNETSDLKYFLISLALHLTLFLVFAVKVVLFPGERLEYMRAVRVDFVALPDKDPQLGPPGEEKPAETQKEEPTKKEEAPSELKEKTVAKEKKETSTKAEKKESAKAEKAASELKDKQSSALKRLEALAKIKKLKATNKDTPEGVTVKGNQLSQGNSLTGVEKIDYNRYLSDLDMHIKKNWRLPEWLANKPLTAAVFIRFDERGQILEKKLLRSSGNSDFDKDALQAVVQSVPFPTPPENLINYFQSQGIELRFPE